MKLASSKNKKSSKSKLLFLHRDVSVRGQILNFIFIGCLVLLLSFTLGLSYPNQVNATRDETIDGAQKTTENMLKNKNKNNPNSGKKDGKDSGNKGQDSKNSGTNTNKGGNGEYTEEQYCKDQKALNKEPIICKSQTEQEKAKITDPAGYDSAKKDYQRAKDAYEKSNQGGNNNNQSGNNQNSGNKDNDDKKLKNVDDKKKQEEECGKAFFGLGGLICSGGNMVNAAFKILYEFVQQILSSQVNIVKSSVVKQNWETFLNIANVVLIIAFLVVIYSTATSVGGLSNYDVKKLLPRIIIFSIAINISYYICMALSDLSDIAGKSLYALLTSGIPSVIPDPLSFALEIAKGAIEGITGIALGLLILFLAGGPVIIMLITVILAIAVRSVALVVLVIVSPIAIALYVFNQPGISKGYQLWATNYIKLLLVYPLFMIIWGGSQLVASIIRGANEPALSFITDLAVAFAPGASILPLFKASGDILGKATVAMSSFGNQAHGKMKGRMGQSKGGGKKGASGAPGKRGLGAGLAGLAGAAAGRAAGAVQNRRGGASTGNIATQLDSQAMDSARSQVDKYNDRDLKTAFTTGQIGSKTLDPYQMRAVIEKELPNASVAEVKQSMQTVNTEADKLRRNGRAADADRLVQTFVSTASANGNSIMGGKSLRNFAASGGWNTSQFEANYADAVADYSSTQFTAQDAADMDAADLIQMRTTLQNAGANGGDIASADAGIRNMARQSNIALSDPELTRKMSAPTVTALNDNTMVRSTAGEKVADAYKVPNIYHDYNAGGAASTKAISDAKTMMMRSGFSKLDAIDQSRLRTIAGASAPTGTGGAPTTPVVIATWDKRR